MKRTAPKTESARAKPRSLSRVLAQVTLLLALMLGAVSGVLQIWSDLQQEKESVQYAAEDFLASIAPSAASAAYNFYYPAAEQVVEGLFTQRAISAVTIINGEDVMIAQTREVTPTLPQLPGLPLNDLVFIEAPLLTPEGSNSEVIGSISITIDRSAVAPAFVNRMVSYFLFATLKNFLLGILLILIVYGALARHIVRLAELIGTWAPEQGHIHIPTPPKLLQHTELHILGDRLQKLAKSATDRIKEVEASRRIAEDSNSQLSEESKTLSEAIQRQNIELHSANLRLKELAERDTLTGLYNRGWFDKTAAEIFERARAKNEHVSILLIDVDFFKAYNDFYGHQSGDTCLEQVARTLETVLESEETIVSRYGGEEFVALVSGSAAQDASHQAERIHQALSEKAIEHQRSTIGEHITVSIGVAHARFDQTEETSLTQMISDADQALYEAKSKGRATTVESSVELRKRVQKSRAEALHLRVAIENGAFEPFFQPQFDARTGKVFGYEALVRWRRDDGAYATPDAFMDTALANGYVARIDALMVEKVWHFLAEAKQRNIFIPRVALNAPLQTLFANNYIQKLVKLVDSTDTQIALELLETAIFDKPDKKLMWHLDSLYEANVEIEIDDFGTGHTSILGLMAVRPTRLKIAKEIVMPMSDAPAYKQVVQSIVQISTSLGIEVMAEGVENEQMSSALIQLGCPIQQGYHFARPMQAEDILDACDPQKDTSNG